MTSSKWVFLIVAIASCLSFATAKIVVAPHEENDRKIMWKKVDEAMQKSLPKTAIEQLDKIITTAKSDKAFDDAIRAVCRKYQITMQIQGGSQSVAIKLLQADLAQYPAEMQPVLKAILANWYWNYYQQNRWQFQQRTQTAQAPGEDFETWDLNRILAESESLFVAALAERETLQKIPVEKYSDLLVAGTVPDKYRPTMFDFLAQQAITFYRLAEQRIRPQDAFDLSAETPVFGSTQDFLAWKLPENNTSPIVKALQLFQDLLQFHGNDDDPAARWDLDLQRLGYGHDEAYGTEKDARYAAALERYIEMVGDHELGCAASAALATLLQSQTKAVEAREVCQQALARNDKGPLANRCRNIIAQIEARSASITTERVWNQPSPSINVTYRNVDKVFFRLVPFDFSAWAGSGSWSPENIDQSAREKLLRDKPARQWSANLPRTTDYRQRVEKITVPPDLSPGSYYLISSHREDFDQGDNQLSFCEVWVSSLALIQRTRYDNTIEGMVLDALGGKPIAGAQVELWVVEQRQRREKFQLKETLTTDQNGIYRKQINRQFRYMVRAKHNNQSLASANGAYSYGGGNWETDQQSTVFFTDRSIYRPGQTIQFKGVLVDQKQSTDSYRVIPGRSITVALFDHNNQQVEELKLVSNRFGSISGSFTAPRDRGTGQMFIQVTSGADGATSFNVEEYKRPKFFVEVNAPKVATRLGDKVNVTGMATSYTSAPIDGASVSYRVVRGVQLAPWWYWRCWWWPINTQVQEISHGTTTTKMDGSFDVDFLAIPDRTIPKLSEPKFSYTIYADVTDSTGETRSNSVTINVGYTALNATVAFDEWQTSAKPVSVKVATTTLDGEPQTADATIKVYRLKSPDSVERTKLSPRWYYFRPNPNLEKLPDVPPDWSDINTWPTAEEVVSKKVTTDAEGNATEAIVLGTGAYKVVVESQDRFGSSVRDEKVVQVLDPNADRFAIKLPDVLRSEKSSVEVGDEFMALWGTGYDAGQAYVEIEHRGKIVKAYWTDAAKTQQLIRVPVTESLRGGFTIHVSHVQENRAYLSSVRVDVPWSNKELKLKWEHFVSKLEPGAKEEWTLSITGPDAASQAMEMVASLYDASLDAFLPHNWPRGFNVFRMDQSRLGYSFENQLKSLNYLAWNWRQDHHDETWIYRHYADDVVIQFGGRFDRGRMMFKGATRSLSLAEGEAQAVAADELVADSAMGRVPASGESLNQPATPSPDLSQVTARKNLNETAFFFPNLIAEKDGQVTIKFTMPEALTEWKFLGFAHDADLRAGLITDKVVTKKDLMVQPNPPRFLREGDVVEFTAKVMNQSATMQTGTARLALSDAANSESLDSQFGNATTDQAFEIPSGQSKTISWKLTVPDGARILTYKVVGATDRLSDGEEGFLPVLSKRVLVKESLPLPIRGNQTREFDFKRMAEAVKSDSLVQESLTVQVTSNPAWYAVLALPYLMEFPHECNEQIFNRLYANALGQHIANSDPKIKRIFEQWRGTDALDSPLEKNEDLKLLMIQETPWLLEAKQESQARRNVGILFEDNRMNSEIRSALQKLGANQLVDGTWSWFPGGRSNEFITLYITTGFGRLRHLGVAVDISPAIKSLAQLDQWINEQYQRIANNGTLEANHLSPTICFYLYGRSFFLKDQPIDASAKTAVDYFLGQAKQYWPKLNDRMPQGHVAIALKRFGDLNTPAEIVKSLRERSLQDDEMGMYWREGEEHWWWYRAPIESQALMIEVFDEIAADAAAVEELQIWLVKQKQTQDWKTTKATADAVYALLGRGRNWLAADELVEVKLGGIAVEHDKVEAGTGYYRHRYPAAEIKPEMAQITVVNPNPGIAWGSVHWQYLEDMSKVTSYEGTPLKLKKSLYVKKNTNEGPTLVAVGDDPVAVGDQLVVRIELRVDRDMEFVHMKDYRGSGTEPVDVLSQYRYQDGLAYYQSTRDTASHFFIDYLPRGTYVFEYSTRVQLRGDYQTGFAEIQCMYAPEFGSHSESLAIKAE